MKNQILFDLWTQETKERINSEIQKILENIQDEKTKATEPRTLTITIKITPDKIRENIEMDTSTKIKLEPQIPISSSLSIGTNKYPKQIPGQQTISIEQELPQETEETDEV